MMEYVWSTIDFLVMYLFALCFFKPRRRIGKRIDFIILIVVAVMASFINDYFANSDINLVVTIIFIVVVLGFFEGNWKRKLFVGSSFFAFIITIEGIVALSIGYFFHIEASEMPKLDSDITQFFQRFLTELRLILVLVLYFFSRRKKNAPERKVQKSFLIIPILSAVLIIYLHEAQIMRNSIDLIFSWIVTIIVIVINIITYILFRKQEQYHIAEGEMKNQLKEYEYQKLHYEQVEQHQQEIRKIRHDMKNQIAGIYGYLEKGEIEEGKREVCSILNQLEKAEQKLFTANAVVNGILNEKLKGLKLKSDVSDGVIFATEAEFTDLCIVFMLAVTVYFLVLDEKKNKLYPLLRSCYRGRGSVIGAKLTVAACVTALLVLLFYGVDYLYAWQKYGFGDLSRPIQSVTTMYESPYMMSVGMFLFLYLIVKMAVCYVIILGMIWIAQKSETPSGAMIGIGAVGIAEYMLSAFLPSVSYADVFKYVNLAEYMKVYPLFSKYHNLDFFDNPVNAMTVFRIVLPVVLVLFVLGNVRRFFRCAKTKRRWRRERKNSSRIGFISDKLYFYESVKCLFSNRAIWVCIAVMYGAVLVGNSIPTYRDIKEEYYKFYMTDQQGKMTEEKVEYFNEERKRFEEIYSMTPENSDLTAVEIVQKQEENKYAHEGFSEAYSQVMYIMSNNQGKGVNEQELVYEKGYQLLFGDKAVKERLIGILLCVIAAVYSASGVLGTEYDLKVMNLLRSTKRGRKELFLKKLGVSFGITAVIFVLVKIPAILKVVGEYPLECWGAKVRSMMFAGQSVINCSIFGYVLMLMIMQLVTLFVIVFSTMALSVVLKDSTMTMILSLLLFGGPLLIEWGGVPIVHYLSLNSLLDGHQILQGNWLVLISEIVIFWGALSFAAGYVLYRAYENRR